MTILIGCDSFLSLRNVKNADLGIKLEGKRVVVLTAPDQFEGSRQVAPDKVELKCLLDFDAAKDPHLVKLMDRAYNARKCYYDPRTMWQKLLWSAYYRYPKGLLATRLALLKQVAKFYFFRGAGWLGFANKWRQDFAQALQKHPIMDQYKDMFVQLDVKVVAAFSLEGPREMALIEAARKAGLRTLVMIRSRDNLAAKIQHLPDADAYIVWAESTRDFLLRLYPEIAPERVHVTGTPQFDRHLDVGARMSREEFFSQIGLDPARPLIVYTGATPGLVQHEPDIAQHLADAIRDGKFLKNAQLLVRGHPRSFGSNHRLLRTLYSGVALYPLPTDIPMRTTEHETQVVRLILEDEATHLSTLAYQDVQVNISGTMIVDSAILDKPSVCVYYDIPRDIPYGLSSKRFYSRSDMQSILKSGGIKLAHSPDECIQLINRYLQKPDYESEGREKIRRLEAGPLDGQAGERIATLLRNLAQ